MQKCASAWPRSSPTYKFDVNENSDCYFRYPAFSQIESAGENALQENERKVNFQLGAVVFIGRPRYLHLFVHKSSESLRSHNQ